MKNGWIITLISQPHKNFVYLSQCLMMHINSLLCVLIMFAVYHNLGNECTKNILKENKEGKSYKT